MKYTLVNKYYSDKNKMGETGETEKQGETVNVEKEKGNSNLTPEEAKIKAARVKKMEQLLMKLKTTKTMMTKNINKKEPVIALFEKYETQASHC